MNQKAEVLRNLLDIPQSNLPKIVNDRDENGNTMMSEMVKQILQWDSQNQIGDAKTDIQNKMTESVDKVKSQSIPGGIISKNDAINLWAATMQACEASLTQRMPYTVVMRS